MIMRAPLLLLTLAVARTTAEEPPPAFTADNFGAVVTASRRPFVVEFYSEMCGSCKEFAPTWHALEAELARVDGLGVGRVCVDKPPGVKLASSLDGLFDKGIPQVPIESGAARARACDARARRAQSRRRARPGARDGGLSLIHI